MSNQETTSLKSAKSLRRTTAVLLLAILAGGGFFTWWTISRANSELRAGLLQQTRVVAQAVDLERMQALSGTEADLNSPAYLRLKEQLAAIRLATPLCRFVYLLGQKADGRLFFFVDSEPASSPDCSPAGQIYVEAPEGDHRAFATRTEVVEGPYTDRWGKWVSGLVPILDSRSELDTGKVLAVLGMDIDARTWNWMLARAALPAVLLMLALVAVLLSGSELLGRRARIAGVPPQWMLCLEPGLAAAVGIIVTLFASWTVHEAEKHDRNEAFVQLAASRVRPIAETLHDLIPTKLDLLARFYECNARVPSGEFRRFTAGLAKNSAGQAWEWIPVVQAADKSSFEEEARAAGLTEFEIWQKDADGKRMPAIGRDVYYPVFEATPLAGNGRALGYDLGSERLRRAALEEAFLTGLPTGTDPVTLVQESGTQIGILIYRPVFGADAPRRLRGFALAVLRVETLLESAGLDRSALMEISLLRTDSQPLPVVTAMDSGATPSSGLSVTRPIFAFGKVFAVTAHAGPEFMRLHPMHGGWRTAFTGLLLIAAFVAVISVIVRRREELERLVFERTTALRKSEENLSATLRSIGDGVIACDAAGNVVSLNAVAETLTGWSASEASGRPIAEVFQIIHAETRDKAEIPVNRALSENRIIELANHTSLIARTGTERQIADSCAPIHDAAGCVLGAVLVFRDVTEEYRRREQFRESNARFDQLAEQSRTMTWEVDVQGLFSYVSHVTELVLGYRPEELVGKKHFYDLCGIEAERESLKLMAFTAFEQKEPFQNLEHSMEARDGSHLCFSTNGIPLLNADGTLRGYRGSNTDITDRKRAEEALRQSQDRSRLILNSAAEAIYGIDTEGNCTWCNAACLRLLGYKHQSDLLGKNMHWQVHQKHPDGSHFPVDECRIFEAFQKGEGTHADDEVFWRADGTSFPVEYWSYPQHRDGAVVGAVVTFLDITERKRVENELRKLSRAVEQSPSSTVITDTRGTIEYVNPRFEEVTGYSVQEVIGKNPRILKSGVHSPEFYKEMWDTLLTGNVWHGEICNKKKNGELFWDSVAIAPVRNAAGDITYYVAIKEDITERKRVDAELQKAKEDAVAANRAKSAFLASMSHEIRTPMNAILGFSQLMLRDAALSPQQQERLNTINRSGEHLLALINDILEMSKIEAGRTILNLVSFDLHELLDDLERMFCLRTDAKGLCFTVERVEDIPQFVGGDQAKLRQVLINLLGNAVKFTHTGGIQLRVRRGPEAKRSGLCLWFEVEDTGMGISEEDSNRLFERFEQTESGRMIGEGTGLGLAISREFVRLMEGDITVTSQLGKGSIFRFNVRLEANDRLALPCQKPVSRGLPHLRPGCPAVRLLIVDDKNDNRLLLCQMLAPAGIELREAVNGADGFKQFKEWRPDIILMDLIMPEMDGYEAIRRIRSTTSGRQVKIIALTASVFEENRREAMASGADGFMGKPFQEADLFEIIRTTLGIEYEYEGKEPEILSAPAARSGDSISASMAALPDELLAQIGEAVALADYDQVTDLIAQVAGIDAGLAQNLSRIAGQFDSVRLLQLIRTKRKPNT